MKALVIASILLLLGFSLNANLDSLFNEANRAYDNKNYNEAFELYETVLNEDVHSYELYLNTAQAAYNSGELFSALLYYEKAIKLKGASDDIQSKISSIRDEMGIEIYKVSDFFLIRVQKKMATLLSSNNWLFVQLLIAMFLAYSVYRWRFSADALMRRRYFFSSCGLLFLLFICLYLGHVAYSEEYRNPHYLLKENTEIYEAADERSGILRDLPKGAKIQKLDAVGEWSFVSLQNKERGWIHSSLLVEI